MLTFFNNLISKARNRNNRGESVERAQATTSDPSPAVLKEQENVQVIEQQQQVERETIVIKIKQENEVVIRKNDDIVQKAMPRDSGNFSMAVTESISQGGNLDPINDTEMDISEKEGNDILEDVDEEELSRASEKQTNFVKHILGDRTRQGKDSCEVGSMEGSCSVTSLEDFDDGEQEIVVEVEKQVEEMTLEELAIAKKSSIKCSDYVMDYVIKHSKKQKEMEQKFVEFEEKKRRVGESLDEFLHIHSMNQVSRMSSTEEEMENINEDNIENIHKEVMKMTEMLDDFVKNENTQEPSPMEQKEQGTPSPQDNKLTPSEELKTFVASMPGVVRNREREQRERQVSWLHAAAELNRFLPTHKFNQLTRMESLPASMTDFRQSLEQRRQNIYERTNSLHQVEQTWGQAKTVLEPFLEDYKRKIDDMYKQKLNEMKKEGQAMVAPDDQLTEFKGEMTKACAEPLVNVVNVTKEFEKAAVPLEDQEEDLVIDHELEKHRPLSFNEFAGIETGVVSKEEIESLRAELHQEMESMENDPTLAKKMVQFNQDESLDMNEITKFRCTPYSEPTQELEDKDADKVSLYENVGTNAASKQPIEDSTTPVNENIESREMAQPPLETQKSLHEEIADSMKEDEGGVINLEDRGSSYVNTVEHAVSKKAEELVEESFENKSSVEKEVIENKTVADNDSSMVAGRESTPVVKIESGFVSLEDRGSAYVDPVEAASGVAKVQEVTGQCENMTMIPQNLAADRSVEDKDSSFVFKSEVRQLQDSGSGFVDPVESVVTTRRDDTATQQAENIREINQSVVDIKTVEDNSSAFRNQQAQMTKIEDRESDYVDPVEAAVVRKTEDGEVSKECDRVTKISQEVVDRSKVEHGESKYDQTVRTIEDRGSSHVDAVEAVCGVVREDTGRNNECERVTTVVQADVENKGVEDKVISFENVGGRGSAKVYEELLQNLRSEDEMTAAEAAVKMRSESMTTEIAEVPTVLVNEQPIAEVIPEVFEEVRPKPAAPIDIISAYIDKEMGDMSESMITHISSVNSPATVEPLKNQLSLQEELSSGEMEWSDKRSCAATSDIDEEQEQPMEQQLETVKAEPEQEQPTEELDLNVVKESQKAVVLRLGSMEETKVPLRLQRKLSRRLSKRNSSEEIEEKLTRADSRRSEYRQSALKHAMVDLERCAKIKAAGASSTTREVVC